jgi:hypothetical protein
MENSIIHKARLRKFILEKIKSMRPGWRCDRVSKAAIDQIEAKLRAQIIDYVRRHPTVGQTFKEIF